ncbi:MAG: DUF4363 family protein [Clostridia bacterium]|nr:DUF4363 family protein [Clostridia bacterium]
MKIKSIIIWILFIILISCATVEEIFISNSLNKINTLAVNLRTKLETQEIDLNIKNDLDYLTKEWDKTEHILCYLNNHNDLKEIGDALRYAKSYLNDNEKEDAIEKIDIVIYYADSYKKLLLFNLQNVF